MSDGLPTLGGLERLTYMPDRPNDIQGDRIAGQFYYDVEFTGGSLSNVSLTDVTINGVTTARNETIVTGIGNYAVVPSDYVITINRTVPEAASVVLPTSPTTSRSIIVKDGAGNAAAFPITIDGNGKTIDGQPSLVLDRNFIAIELIYNGTEWNGIGEYLQGDGAGDVNGPAVSTDNAIARWDGITGNVIKDSTSTLDNSGNATFNTINLLASASHIVLDSDAANTGTLTATTLTAPRTWTLPNASGTFTIGGNTFTGTGDIVRATSPTLITPNIGAATGSLTGNASTATALQTTRNIGNVSFNGTANIVPQTIQTVDDAADTTCFPLFGNASGSQTAGQQPKTNANLTFNASTGALGATSFSGAGTGLTGTASGLTAGTVTTNANLTGAVTSVGNATSLGSFTSAQLATALSDETGTGANVFATNPVLVTPNLGTPSAGVLTNATGLPIVGGTTGTLTETRGGTNQTTYTTGDLLYASGANTLAKRAVGTTGQVLTVVGGVPTWATAAAGAFTLSYSSPAQAIASGGPLTLAHGMGIVPKLISGRLVCVTAQAGYTAGQQCYISINPANGTSTVGRGFTARSDATNIYVRYGNNGNAFQVLDISSGATVDITNANWQLIIDAWG